MSAKHMKRHAVPHTMRRFILERRPWNLPVITGLICGARRLKHNEGFCIAGQYVADDGNHRQEGA